MFVNGGFKAILWGVLVVSITLLISTLAGRIPSDSKLPIFVIILMVLLLIASYLFSLMPSIKTETAESQSPPLRIELTFKSGFNFGLGLFAAAALIYLISLIITLMLLTTLGLAFSL